MAQARRVTVVNAQVSATPFYLEKTLLEPGNDGNLSVFGSETVARRSDGTTARVKSVGPRNALRNVRDLSFLDGRFVTLFDSVRVKSTWPQKSAAEAGAMKWALTNPQRDCGAHPPQTVLRHDSVDGEEVVVIQLVAGQYRLTRWVAPKLGCEALYYKSEAIKADGSFSVSVEAKLSQFVLGEPDPKWFDPGQDFPEVKPSDAYRLLLKDMGLELNAEERMQIEQEGREADRRYQR